MQRCEFSVLVPSFLLEDTNHNFIHTHSHTHTHTHTQVGIALLMLNAGKNRHVITAQNVSKQSYWLTRVLLLRGMALCYLAGFSTSAFQARALFGSLGLQPASFSARVRPTPAFDFLERSEWGPKLQLGDWALDAVSWAGRNSPSQ